MPEESLSSEYNGSEQHPGSEAMEEEAEAPAVASARPRRPELVALEAGARLMMQSLPGSFTVPSAVGSALLAHLPVGCRSNLDVEEEVERQTQKAIHLVRGLDPAGLAAAEGVWQRISALPSEDMATVLAQVFEPGLGDEGSAGGELGGMEEDEGSERAAAAERERRPPRAGASLAAAASNALQHNFSSLAWVAELLSLEAQCDSCGKERPRVACACTSSFTLRCGDCDWAQHAFNPMCKRYALLPELDSSGSSVQCLAELRPNDFFQRKEDTASLPTSCLSPLRA